MKVMEARTRQQENKYGMALGYVWGRKDAATDTFTLLADSMAFAAWYSLKEEREDGRSLTRAFDAFLEMPMEEQKRVGRESMRLTWNPYADK